jgi:hypothetical protein
MKFSEFLKEENEGSLIGKTINGKLITKDTKNEHWKDDFDFNCSYNKLTSLAGAPASVGCDFNCSYNKLTSLEGAPASVGYNFICYDNKLTSLDGAPASVGGYFYCGDNQLTSLAGIHKIIKKMNAFLAYKNDIKSHVLGLLMIPGCKSVELDNEEVEKILNKYLPNTGGNQVVMKCQTELIEAGYRDYAKL